MEIQLAMASSKRNQLEGTIQKGEFLIGQYKEGKIDGSEDSKKKLVIVALEILADKGCVRSNESPRRKRSGYHDGLQILFFAASGGEFNPKRLNISYNCNTEHPDCIHML